METNTREKINLAGTWQIAFDPANGGVKGGWVGAHWPEDRALPVEVPGIWNIAYPDVEGIGFYRTEFSVPDSWAAKNVLLRFEGVFYRCEVWVNGSYVGSHEGGYTPFSFDVSAHLRSGEENYLVVRVASLSKTRPVDGLLLHQSPASKQSWYYVYAGIWGEVTLESCPWIACQSLAIDPDLRREIAQVELGLNNRRAECRQVQVRMRVLDPRGEVAFEQQSRLANPPGLANYTFSLPLPQPLAWSCENPHLYHLETQVTDEDGEMDQYSTTFGMRDFTVRDGVFYLNSEPIYIRGILLQPNFPVNLITHPNPEMAVREISLAKEAGFNLLRTHIQPAPPGYLDLTDQMGILVYSETSLAWIRESPRMMEHGRRETKALIDRDHNHPSIVIWGIYNENPPATAFNGKALAQYARTLDPARVIVENSGGSLAIDQDFGWIDRATITPAWEVQGERILDIHVYLGSPLPDAVYDWLHNLGGGVPSTVLADEGFGSVPVFEEFDRECRSYNGKIFVSEFGCAGMSDLDKTVAGFGGREDLLDARELKAFRDSLHQGFEQRGLRRIFGSLPNLISDAQKLQAIGNSQHMEAVLSNPRISGYVMTQLNDVSFEFHGGLVDLWRNPKLAHAAAIEMNQPRILILKAKREVAVCGETIDVKITLVNGLPLLPETRLHVSASPSNVTIATNLQDVPLHAGIHPLGSVQVKTGNPGEYHILASLVVGGETLADSSQTILVLEDIDWKDLGVSVKSWGKPPESAYFQKEGEAKSPIRNIDGNPWPIVNLAAHPATLSEEDWNGLFQAIESGGVCIVGALRPEDNQAIQAINQRGVDLKLKPGIGSWIGCYHWVPDSPIFIGLPSGGLAMKRYTEVLPKYVLFELGGEVQAGSLRNTQTREEPPSMLWYSDIEALRFGKGSIIFCQYRAFEKIDGDPVASRLAYNLLRYAAQMRS